MTAYIMYTIVILTSVIILFKLLLLVISNTSSGFWLSQPVFHIHNIYYWINPIGIVNKAYPPITKYVNLTNTKIIKIMPSFSSDFKNQPQIIIKQLCAFIRDNYLIHELVTFYPSFDDIIAYLECNTRPSFFITYDKRESYNASPHSQPQISGLMTARILNVSIKIKSAFNDFSVYYVDNLCVEPSSRKLGITPQLIQTMYYHVSREIPSVNVYMFKREMKLNNIIPLTYYNTLCFDTQNIKSIYPYTTHYLIEISEINVNLFIDFIKYNKSKFDCIILPDESSLVNLIIKKKLTIFLYIVDNVVLLSIVYRNTTLAYNNIHAIECISIVSTLKYSGDNDLLLKLFCESLAKQGNTGILIIDDVSDSKHLIKKLSESFNIMFKIPNAFYLFNYVCYSYDKYKTLLIY